MSKVVVITGASSGIGKACALAFAKAGYAVVISARNQEKLSLVEKDVLATGAACLAVPTDVSNEQECQRLMQETRERFGTIHVLINNAGLSMRALFAELDLQVMHRLMNTNFWGAVYCTKYALPDLLKNQGSVVGVSSIAGKKGLPGRTGYSASKFALEGFLETLRTENLKNKLHVLVACPGFTATEIRQTALAADGTRQGESPRAEKEMMSADEVATAILKAVVKRKRDLVLTGNGKLTVFLNKFIPGILDGMVYNHMSKEPGSPFK